MSVPMWYGNKIVSGLGTPLETSCDQDQNTELSKVPGATPITLTPSHLKRENQFYVAGDTCLLHVPGKVSERQEETVSESASWRAALSLSVKLEERTCRAMKRRYGRSSSASLRGGAGPVIRWVLQ